MSSQHTMEDMPVKYTAKLEVEAVRRQTSDIMPKICTLRGAQSHNYLTARAQWTSSG